MQVAGVLPDFSAIPTSAGGCRSQELKHFASFFDGKQHFLSPGLPKNCLLPPNHKLVVGSEKLRTRSFMVRASGNYSGDFITVPPLKLESSVGELLAQIQQTHPHLLLASAEQQLENLQSQRDDQKETNALPAQDLLLYERIAKVKEKERRKTLQDIMYCLIVQRFLENRISMIPKITITSSDPSGRIDLWPNQEQQLESVHSPEAFEMITSHLAIVLGEQAMGPLDTIIQISKIKLGKLYAASIMYGYFLRRVDERYQLERSMGTLPEGFGEEEQQALSLDEPVSEKQLWDPDSLIRIYPDDGGGDDVAGIMDEEKKSYKLRSYVMYLDGETLQRYATMRSGEAVSLIEKQTQALFGRPDIKVTEDGSLDASNDEAVSLTFSGLTMLVLEAVAFGSFLWDTENFVESKYPFINS
ncbi:Protein of unknown function (DUF760 [Striga hermonthica]|uniref:UV-B-induced protein At3g17800, chloroplastic-like n=1 Tax=Striga hermonthica TaxID=68872 RepID=A0A9N7P2V0_STRHE|nr:Protein of unknown function (DUF760 [Striga hermonthica]